MSTPVKRLRGGAETGVMTIAQNAQTSSRGQQQDRPGRRTSRRQRFAGALLVVAAAVSGLVASDPLTAPAPADAATVPTWSPHYAAGSCLTRGGTVLHRAGYQSAQIRLRRAPYRTTVDARRAIWGGTVNYPVSLSGGPFACTSGGLYRGGWSSLTSWAAMHSVAAMRMTNYAPIVENARIHNYGDGIRFAEGAQYWRVRRVYLSYLRDDCIENDWAYSGVVEDSLLDGCYNAFSARGYDSQSRTRDGSADIVRVRDSLVRLQPMKSVYKNRGRVPGHAGFFKWDAAGPRLSIRSTVFRADQDANTVGLAVPAGKLVDCANNTVVWLGAGPYPEKLPSCFRVTRDRAVWDRAVVRWKQAHGYLPR